MMTLTPDKTQVLREALEPFAHGCEQIERDYGDDLPAWQFQFPQITMADLRRAKAALAALSSPKQAEPLASDAEISALVHASMPKDFERRYSVASSTDASHEALVRAREIAAEFQRRGGAPDWFVYDVLAGKSDDSPLVQVALAAIQSSPAVASDDVREAFDAGWEASERKWLGPSAAGYPDEPEEAWQLFDMGRAEALRSVASQALHQIR